MIYANHDYTIDYNKSLSRICRKSFFQFTKKFWTTIIEDEPVWNWHIEYLCEEAQKVLTPVFTMQPKIYDLIINISPGETKSTLFSVLLTPWALTNMPRFRSINGSFALDLGLEMSRKARDVMESDLYHDLFPEVQIRKDQNTKSNFVTTGKGQRITTATGAGITGKHAHALIVDDPLDPRQAASDIELLAANNWMEETLPSRKVDKRVTPLILIHQRLHQNDPTGSRMAKVKAARKRGEEDKVKLISLPASDEYPIHPPELKDHYVDGLMNPSRTSRAVLEDVRDVSGEFVLAGQYGQQPVPRGGGMFQIPMLKRGRSLPEGGFTRIVRYWDKAGSHDAGCWTVGCKMGLEVRKVKGMPRPLKRFWILDILRFRRAVHEREELIYNAAMEDGYDVEIYLEQEGGSGGKDQLSLSISGLAGFRVYGDKPVGDKVVRADPAAVQWNNGNFVMMDGEWNDDCIDEVRYFPYSTYKDQVDAISGAFTELARPRIKIGAVR